MLRGIWVGTFNGFAFFTRASHGRVDWQATQCVKLSIEAGADVNAKYKEGRTPLSWVKTDSKFHFPGDEEKKEIADLLRKAGTK